MIGRMENKLRKLRRFFSRSEWAIRLLHLSRYEGTSTEPGLIMIQIDGLARKQILHAIKRGDMPFLRRLLRHEHYTLHRFYSGLPSSTPSVQGELFYGEKTIVPSFRFVDGQTHKIYRMFDVEAASNIEKRLAEKGEPLLLGGSAYCDIYTGGAAESRFCSATMGWGDLIGKGNPFALPILFITHIASFLRIPALMILEVGLAIYDFFKGISQGKSFWKELKFIPTRVGITILLRELVTISTTIDAARGFPIIHLNYIGYDEQAHRRGPSSAFAHWALKGIDKSIKRIWNASHRSARRTYDIWVYSDHGQEETIPYPIKHGKSIQQAVAEIFAKHNIGDASISPSEHGIGIEFQRIRLLGEKLSRGLAPQLTPEPEAKDTELIVTAMGPVGHIYSPEELSEETAEKIARDLVESAHVPFVLQSDKEDVVWVWDKEGKFKFTDSPQRLLGKNHPHLEETAKDLLTLTRHPAAGTFLILGWRPNEKPYSFPVENGSHAGPGSQETDAFAILPSDTPLSVNDKSFIRPSDLREAALRFLGRTQFDRETLRTTTGGKTLRVMTYNVHTCVGMDGNLSPERIARVIARYEPDVVALQELDVGRSRTGSVDQAEVIAQHLQMEFHFHPAIHLEEEKYGDAILSRYPIKLIRAAELPYLDNGIVREPRGAIWVEVQVDGIAVQIINTHLGFTAKEQALQTDELLGPKWLAHPDCHEPVVLLGDFNSMPRSQPCRRITRRLRDVQIELDNHKPRNTWFGRYPVGRIDHVFIGQGLDVLDIDVGTSQLTRVASDHLPLIVDLQIKGE